MKGSVITQLILKDWRLQRSLILMTMGGGAIALAIVQHGGEPAIVVGSVFFFIAIILAGNMVPMASITNERKKQNLAFLMSLPVTSVQYAAAKLMANLALFLIPWLTLVISALLLVETRGLLPRGTIPLLFIAAFLPFLGFCLVTGAALVGEKEGWGIAASAISNSSYGLTWYFIMRSPALVAHAGDPSPVWNSTVLTVLAVEIAAIILTLGLTFFLQSRKTDFV
jgi:ABC-2 type transport system permease protein